VIESSRFEENVIGNEGLLSGSRVMLCTISMLSTDWIMECGFTQLVPVQTLIIDEASQIEVGDYLPVLARYKTSLRKMVFIGDDKQRRCWWCGWGWCEVIVC
jgi:regulator of nonsense transcripts 1